VLGASDAAEQGRPVKPGISRPPRQKKGKASKALVLISLAVLAAMVVAAVGTLLYQRKALPPRPGPEPKPAAVTSPQPDPEKLRARVAGLLAGLECASVRSRLSDDGTLSLSGFVSTPEDLARVQGEAGRLAGIDKVDARLAVQPWPFCTLLEVIAPLQPAGATPERLPQLNLNHADRRYRTGERLVVTAAVGMGFEGYLYVDYIDSDGSVVHLLPSPRQKQNHMLPGQKIVLGALDPKDASGDFVYEIQPPLGPGIVVAFASRHRILEAPRPHVETTGDYVPALQAALATRPSGEPHADLVSTHTTIEIYE
jgi:hypothetical protein